MAFNLRHLFLFVFVMSIALALTPWFSPPAAFTIFVLGALPLIRYFPKSTRYYFFYGGFLGMFLGLLIAHVAASAIEANDSIRANGSRTGADWTGELVASNDRIDTYGLVMGFVFGAAIGVLIEQQFSKSRNKLAGILCPNCGRKISKGLIVCNKCAESTCANEIGDSNRETEPQ